MHDEFYTQNTRLMVYLCRISPMSVAFAILVFMTFSIRLLHHSFDDFLAQDINVDPPY